MLAFLVIAISVLLGAAAMPLGLLPAILLFRDLADGKDATPARKRAYRAATVLGMLVAWALGTFAVWAAIVWLIGG